MKGDNSPDQKVIPFVNSIKEYDVPSRVKENKGERNESRRDQKYWRISTTTNSYGARSHRVSKDVDESKGSAHDSKSQASN